MYQNRAASSPLLLSASLKKDCHNFVNSNSRIYHGWRQWFKIVLHKAKHSPPGGLEPYCIYVANSKWDFVSNTIDFNKPPWRNWLARSAVNRKVGGSSPPGGECFVLLYNYLKHFTQIHPMFFSHQKNYRSLPMWVQCFPLVFWVVGVYYPLRYGLVVRIAGSHPAGSGSIPGTGIFFPNFHLFFQIMFLPLF